MKRIVVGNLKANLSMHEIGEYIFKINSYLPNNHNVILCPSYIHIPFFTSDKFSIGAQNVSIYDNGNYTGEVTASQLKGINVKYVIVGHSERRKLFNENDIIVNRKIKKCLEYGLKPIVCIGESKEEKLMMKTAQVIRRSLLDSLKDIDKEDMKNIIIAYEPLWSIGTGIMPTAKEIDEIVLFIKDIVKSAYKIDLKVLYGGSINSDNINKLSFNENIDGFLVGGSSNDPIEFSKIVDSL